MHTTIHKIYNPPESASLVFYIISMLCGDMFASLFGLGLKRIWSWIKKTEQKILQRIF